jgi:hypothetical protein
MSEAAFLLLNLALAFYNVGTIWAHEVDIFRAWRLLDAQTFHAVQRAHWQKLPYWIFTPVGLASIGGVALVWVRPAGAPLWAIYGALFCQALALVLTAIFWGRWQAALAQDPRGADSPYLALILRTHWVRTLLINATAVLLLICALAALAG